MRRGVGIGVCLLAVLAGCVAPTDDNPAATCQPAVEQLRQCAGEIRKWQSQEISERPDCIAEDAATPGAAALAELGQEDVARRLELTMRLLKYERPAEGEVLLRDLEGRCAKLSG